MFGFIGCSCIQVLAKMLAYKARLIPFRVSLRILSWGGMGKQDGSRMIVACETHACLRGGSGGVSHPPPKKNLFEFRSSQIASGAIWDEIVV